MNTGGRKFGYANVVATLALVVALSGSAYALSVTGKEVVNGSLTGRDTKNQSLKGRELHQGTVKSKQVKDGGLNKWDMAYDAVSAGDTQLAGQFTASPITLTEPDGFTTLATVAIDIARRSDLLVSNNMLVDSSVPAGAESSEITYRVLVDGVATQQLPQDSLRNGDKRRSNIAVTVKRLEGGSHTVEIQAQIVGADIVAGGRSVNILTVPSS